MSDPQTIRELIAEMGQLAGFIANCPDLIVAQEAGSQICRRERAALDLLNNAVQFADVSAGSVHTSEVFRQVYDPDPAPRGDAE